MYITQPLFFFTHRSKGDPTLTTIGGEVALGDSGGPAALGMDRLNGSRGLAALELAREGRG